MSGLTEKNNEKISDTADLWAEMWAQGFPSMEQERYRPKSGLRFPDCINDRICQQYCTLSWVDMMHERCCNDNKQINRGLNNKNRMNKKINYKIKTSKYTDK